MPDAPAPLRRPTRRLALGGLALAGVTGVVLARRPDRGAGGHDAYFQGLSRALAAAGIAQPTLVIDRARLAANMAAVKANLAGSNLGVRVVVKSLPSPALIDAVATGMNTRRFMVFNGAMLGQMLQARPDGDFLLGKPLPAAQVAAFYQAFPGQAGPQWLVDTPQRLAQYAAIARAHGAVARVNFEIDVGLHRGGFADARALGEAIDLARANPSLSVSGLMGYDPHVPKTLDPAGAYRAVQKTYGEARAVLAAKMGGDPGRFTLNTAGSPTYLLHARDTVANEVSIGSGFVKPMDFDLKTLARHVPAAFIATPVIKALDRTRIPSLEAASGLMAFFDPNTQRAFFIYGGHWLAKPVSPAGLEYNDLFGRSSNQEMLTGSDKVVLAPDDYVFLRPNQSEAVFLQFGDMAVFDRGRIAARWPTLPVSA